MLKRIIASPFFIFPLTACLVFWPLTLQMFALKNDALTYYYPIRTLISDALRNGELPLWTPFINMGYPLHADMQSGAWNPIIWSFAFLSNYSLAAFQYELLFYISFAGIGFYYLCREMGCSKTVAITCAIAFQFSGFMIDSVQFFNCISSACYLPYVFLFFRRMLQHCLIKDALSCAIFMFLLFTGGYPSLFIILSYLLFAYGLFSFFVSENRVRFLRQTIPPVLMAGLIFFLLSLPAIISFVNHLPAIQRGSRQALSVVLENPMNPSAVLSLLFPFGTTARETWLDSSILMRSIYIGILPLAFLIAVFFKKDLLRNREIQFFLVAAAVLLGLAWGEYFFLRKLAYYILPLMDSFRHPALFRLFAIFFLLLTAALSMQNHLQNLIASNIILKKILFALIVITFVVCVTCVVTFQGSQFLTLFHSPGPASLGDLSFENKILIQVPFILLITLSGLFALRKNARISLMLIVITDMFFAAQLNMPITVIGAKNFFQVEQNLNRNPVKFPLPGNSTIEANSANSLDTLYMTGSKIPFSKKIGRNRYFITPGNLIAQEVFYKSSIQTSVFKNPVLYFADSVVQLNRPKQYSSPKIAYSQNDLPSEFFVTGIQNVQVTKLTANSVEATFSNSADGLLVLLQNKYPGWTAFIDDRSTAIVPVNISFMAIRTPAGKHTVRFVYKPTIIRAAFYLSLATLGLLALIYFWPFFPKSKKRDAHRKIDHTQ